MKLVSTIQNYSNLLPISIGILWLFHLSGMIGISLGYEDWFISKTPLNLSIAFVLLILNYPIEKKKIIFTALFFLAGMLVEWIGVHYHFLFGSYTYGASLGPKFDGVPFLIGINWAALVLITGTIASAISDRLFFKVMIGAALMVFLDFFMEVPAPIFDFWTFENGLAPLQNYIAWFGIASVLHFIFQKNKIKGNLSFSVHLYLSQFVFFLYFYERYSI